MHKVLILGGTKFIGRHIVEVLSQSKKYELCLFHRGESGANLFPGINRIIGNRSTNSIAQIAETDWDYVIDCSCYLPDDLERTFKHLSNKLKKYIFISTCSAYDNLVDKSILRNEDAPLSPCSQEQRVEKTLKGYGNKKAECERILMASSFSYVILRPSLTFGPYDYTDRLYYWLYQVKMDKNLLLPDTGKMKISITYVKDLVAVILKSLNKESESKVYNVMSYPMISIEEIVDCAMKVLGRKSNKIIASADFLLTEKVTQWADLPLWLNVDFFNYSNAKMLKELDLTPTSLDLAIQETVAYYDSMNWKIPVAGMSNDRKTKILDKLKDTNTSA